MIISIYKMLRPFNTYIYSGSDSADIQSDKDSCDWFRDIYIGIGTFSLSLILVPTLGYNISVAHTHTPKSVP